MIEALASSESNEWFTPKVYIERVRRVIGDIDLDPASTPAANLVVQAHRILTCEEDALSRDWNARSVFLNPPYGTVNGKSQAGLFIKHMINQYEGVMFDEGITLVNSCTGAKWFKPLFKFPICFVDHRIRFDVPPLPEDALNNWAKVAGHILGRKPVNKRAEVMKKLDGLTTEQLIKFYYAQNQPTKENVFVYFGDKTSLFEKEFNEIGVVK